MKIEVGKMSDLCEHPYQPFAPISQSWNGKYYCGRCGKEKKPTVLTKEQLEEVISLGGSTGMKSICETLFGG